MKELFSYCVSHLAALSFYNSEEAHKEADTIVTELIALRNHLGEKLIQWSGFTREQIKVAETKYRIDCIQYFEPVPYYAHRLKDQAGVMKLYTFKVNDLSSNEVIMYYHLEKTNVLQEYYVLCYAWVSNNVQHRGQLVPYNEECPSYWTLRKDVLHAFQNRSSTSPLAVSALPVYR